MARNKYHHLYKRDGIYYLRKAGYRFSLETRVGTQAIKLRDRLLEHYRVHGDFQFLSEDADELTFGRVAKEWAVVHKKKVKYTSWRDYRSSMNSRVLPVFKDVPIRQIKWGDVEDFKASLDCGAKRVNNILVPMRAVFDFAHKKDYVDVNVMRKVDNLPVEQPDIYPFTSEEVGVIIDVIDPFYEPYVCCRFYTGMRDGEINALRWIDYKENMADCPKLHVGKTFVYGREGKTKTKRSKRYVDCLPPVVEALERQKNLTGNLEFIFLTKDGDRMNPDHFRGVVWKPALKRAGFSYRPPIQTRHSFATISISEGEDIGWVQNMLGHSSLQMIFTTYYAWMRRKTRKDGSALIEALRKAQIEKRSSQEEKKGGEIIPLFDEGSTKTTQRKKRTYRNQL